MRLCHSTVMGGHLGHKKTREKIRLAYFWYGLRTDVAVFIARCDVCGSIKKPSKPARAPLGRLSVSAPFEVISCDHLGPLPITARGNRYILVVPDLFTKWVEIFAVPDQSAAVCANFLANKVIAQYGCPLNILTD